MRASLRKRGWVEKEFKACPAVVTNSNETSNPNSSDNEDDDVVEKGDRTCTSGKMDDEGIDNTEWSAGYEGEDCEYSLLVSIHHRSQSQGYPSLTNIIFGRL